MATATNVKGPVPVKGKPAKSENVEMIHAHKNGVPLFNEDGSPKMRKKRQKQYLTDDKGNLVLDKDGNPQPKPRQVNPLRHAASEIVNIRREAIVVEERIKKNRKQLTEDEKLIEEFKVRMQKAKENLKID